MQKIRKTPRKTKKKKADEDGEDYKPNIKLKPEPVTSHKTKRKGRAIVQHVDDYDSGYGSEDYYDF